jgi:predicted DNA-binding transcriptional regulator AlpA
MMHEEKMNNKNLDATVWLSSLPDYAVLTAPQAQTITSLSRDTLDRLHRERSGPPRVQLSPRRVGYSAGGLREWLRQRSS